jgi:hypothetical protein
MVEINAGRILWQMRQGVMFAESREVLVIDGDTVKIRLRVFYNGEYHNSEFAVNGYYNDRSFEIRVNDAIKDINRLMFED